MRDDVGKYARRTGTKNESAMRRIQKQRHYGYLQQYVCLRHTILYIHSHSLIPS
jgi:hypothetical protein